MKSWKGWASALLLVGVLIRLVALLIDGRNVPLVVMILSVMASFAFAWMLGVLLYVPPKLLRRRSLSGKVYRCSVMPDLRSLYYLQVEKTGIAICTRKGLYVRRWSWDSSADVHIVPVSSIGSLGRRDALEISADGHVTKMLIRPWYVLGFPRDLLASAHSEIVSRRSRPRG